MNETATATTKKSTGAASALAASLDLSAETPGRAVPVFDGVWLIATTHRPGLSKHMFEINNRCFVFRLFDQQAGRTVLLVANAVDPEQAIPEVRRLERETNLPVSRSCLRAAATTCTWHRGTRRFPRRSCWSDPSASRARRTGAS